MTQHSEELVKEHEPLTSHLEETESLVETLDAHEQVVDESDYSELDKQGLIAKAEECLHMPDAKKANEILKRLKEHFEILQQADREEQIKIWAEEGNNPKDFKPKTDELRSKFNQVFHRYQELRNEERKRAEEEKVKNLKLKEQILEQIKSLVESEETATSVEQMRELIRQWKQIRQVPMEFRNDLYERYKFYLDKFYDNLSIFNELKELDREKNLELKIELTKKVEALKEESSIKKAMILLNKYHEDFRNIGPVRKEINQEIWERFKSASDMVLNLKKSEIEKINQEREHHLNLKKLLVEKAESLVMVMPQQPKEWGKIAQEFDKLLQEWKKVGPVPQHENEAIWNKFKQPRIIFNAARKEYFKGLGAEREDNLNKKLKLIEQAEALKNQNDFQKTTEKLLKLQEEWKATGPVPENKSEEIWKQFRSAFDFFFARKNEFYQQRKVEEESAVGIRKGIIQELEALKDLEDQDALFAKLRDAQQRWAKAGFVSGPKHYELQRKYQHLSDFIFQKFKKSSDEMKEVVMKDHYQTLSGAPDGRQKLQFEERKLKDRIGKLNEELSTLENNMSFFALSKNADQIKKQFESNIHKNKELLTKLEKELKVVRSLMNSNAK